jgi:pimeloyl-ACP methyl ester carboxylesterase
MTLSIALQEVAAGTGTPVVLGHGLTLDRHSVQRTADAFAAQGHPVLLWELPGHGAAPRASVSWSVEELGLALAAAIRAAHLAPPVLVGVSMGGYASLEAAGGPAALDVRALVAIGCTGEASPPVDPGRLAGLAHWAMGNAYEPAALSAMATAELGDGHPELQQLCHAWSSDPTCGSRFLPGYLALFTRPDPSRAAANIRGRGLSCAVVRGAHDPWVSAHGADLLAQLLGARSVQIDDAAHQPQHTRSAEVAEAIAALLTES